MQLDIFAERLSELIFDKGKSVSATAKEIGISKTTAYAYLSGQKMPTVENAVKIADYFSCSLDFLVGKEWEIRSATYRPCKPFPERFNEILSQFSCSRYRLEHNTGIAESTLYYWAKGKTSPTLENIILLAEQFDCSIDFLLGRTE